MAKHTITGKTGEQLACTYLEEKGYIILHQNWRNKRQEIDIIAQFNNLLIFVEVKTRTGVGFGEPQDFVGRHKEVQLEKASLAYIEAHQYEGEIRFDILAIVIDSLHKSHIQHIEDAFFPS